MTFNVDLIIRASSYSVGVIEFLATQIVQRW